MDFVKVDLNPPLFFFYIPPALHLRAYSLDETNP